MASTITKEHRSSTKGLEQLFERLGADLTLRHQQQILHFVVLELRTSQKKYMYLPRQKLM